MKEVDTLALVTISVYENPTASNLNMICVDQFLVNHSVADPSCLTQTSNVLRLMYLSRWSIIISCLASILFPEEEDVEVIMRVIAYD